LQDLDLVQILRIRVLSSAFAPNPQPPTPEKQWHEAKQIVACLRGRVFVKSVCPFSAPPSVGRLAVCTVQHSVGLGWLRRVEALDFKRRLWPEAGASTCLVDARPHSFPPPSAAAPPGPIVLVAVVVLLQQGTHVLPPHTHKHTGTHGKDAAPERRRAWRR